MTVGGIEPFLFCSVPFSETKPTPHGLSSVLSQIVLCKSMKPDFNVEEKVSIEKDSREIRAIIAEMGECLPKEDPEKGMCTYVVRSRLNGSKWDRAIHVR